MKKLNPIILLVVIVLGVYVGLNVNNEPTSIAGGNTENSNLKPPNDSAEATQVQKEDQSNKVSDLKYEIIYSIEKRFDGGISYYVLIDPVDLTNTSFIDNVKFLINKLVKEKGKKISIEVFDNKEALDLAYKQYGDLSLDRTLTVEENLWQGTHYIAGFSGELETDLYLNTLNLFPSASSDHPKVGEYVSVMEYNPQ